MTKFLRETLAIPVLVTALLAGADTSSAADAECADYISHYQSVSSDLGDRFKRYAKCLASSGGRDDCDTEFRRLKNAQSDFSESVEHLRSGSCLE